MPKHQQSFPVTGMEKEQALATSYAVFKKLGWPVIYAGEAYITADTLGKGLGKGRLVQAIYNDQQLQVSSETSGGETFDMGNRNKKNTAAFIAGFDEQKNSLSPETFNEHLDEIGKIRAETSQEIEKARLETEEVDKAMNLSGSNLNITYAIMGINVLVFILMAMQGAGIMEANGLVHIKWGSNFGPLTLSGDWWRLLTNVFIHFGIIHLAMNMYALYSIGVYLEPMLGKARYITAYVCTGILASLASLWWHSTPVNSAGASGAIFGLYGLFLALLTTDLIPKSIRNSLLANIGIFVAYNLFYGLKGGIDNSAHIGGLISGSLIGYSYVLSIKKERAAQKMAWLLPAIILATAGAGAFYLQQNKSAGSERAALEQEIKNIDFADSDKFNERYNQFVEYQNEALVPLKGRIEYNEVLDKQLEEISLPAWNKALVLIRETNTMNISPQQKNIQAMVEKYIGQRIIQTNLIKQMIIDPTEKNAGNRQLFR